MRLTQPPTAEGQPDATQPGNAAGSDGAAWATYPEPAPRAPLATTVGTSQLLPSGFTRVGRSVQVFLGLCGLTSLATIVLQLWGLATLRTTAEGNFSALNLYGELSASFGFGATVLLLTTGVIWMAWQHRLAAAVPRWKLRRSPGWHVGSWLIPVVALWFPFQNMVDLHNAVAPAPGRKLPLTYPLWWGLWVASTMTEWLANAMLQQGETTLALVAQAAAATAVGETLSLGSAVLAILVVGDLTRRAVQARDEAVAEADLR